MNYEGFKESLKKAAQRFSSLDKNKVVRIVSHLDADGISACSLLVKALNFENRKYAISIVQQLNKEVIKELSFEPYDYFVFTDLGSGQIKNIKEMLGNKEIFILDHHIPEELELQSKITHVNPHLFGIDGSSEISGSGVVYLFARELNSDIDNFAHIAIIGAIGDIQDNGGFMKLNEEILQTAISKNKVKVIKGLRIFGAQTKPLHKVLEYSTDPYIPGVSGSESGAIQFLNQIGINPKNGSDWKKIVHLEEEEIKKLVAGIIMKRFGEQNPEDVLGNVYLLKEEEKESPTRDAKEFATLLNACGRMGKASLGIGACLGDKKIKEKAIKNLSSYKREIINAINWYYENKNSSFVTSAKGYTLINAQDKVMPTIIGTVASIISKSKLIDEGSYILSMAQLINGSTKVSLRVAGHRTNGVDLQSIMQEIIKDIEGCESGGHSNAAGALIPTDKEDSFITAAKEVLGRKAMEEVIG